MYHVLYIHTTFLLPNLKFQGYCLLVAKLLIKKKKTFIFIFFLDLKKCLVPKPHSLQYMKVVLKTFFHEPWKGKMLPFLPMDQLVQVKYKKS